MLEINQISLTGEIVSGEKNDKGLYLKVRQMVGGKMETIFTVFVPSKANPTAQNFREKDLVLINNGLIYRNAEGEVTIRVTRSDQLQMIKKCLDMRQISAEEVF